MKNQNENETLFTHKQCMDNEITHEQYYRQFVTDETIRTVLRYYIKERLVKELNADKHLSGIKLDIWDRMPLNAATYKMKDCGDRLTSAGKVCILKQAAKMIIESE